MVLFGLQAEVGNSQPNPAFVIGFEPIPLNHKVECSHDESQARTKVVPDSMPDFLEVAYHREHRKYCFHLHSVIPFPALAEL